MRIFEFTRCERVDIKLERGRTRLECGGATFEDDRAGLKLVDAALPHGRDRAANVLIAPLGHRAAVSHTFTRMQRARAGVPRHSVHVPQRGVPVSRNALKRNCDTSGPTPNSPLPFSFHQVKYSIEEIIEPYLMQIGFLNRTSRGRMATRRAYEHFGPDLSESSEPTLFE